MSHINIYTRICHIIYTQAAKKVVAAGIAMVVAAGNDNLDACGYSPADAGGDNSDVITVTAASPTAMSIETCIEATGG